MAVRVRDCPDPACVDTLRPQAEQESEACRNGDDELARVDRSDYFPWFQAAAGENRRGADGTPAAASGRVHESRDESEWGEETFAERFPESVVGDALERESDEDVQPQGEQDQCHHRCRCFGRQIRQYRRADECADRSGKGGPSYHLPVDVAESPVGQT